MLSRTGLRIKLEMSLININAQQMNALRKKKKCLQNFGRGEKEKKIYIRGVARTSDNITYMRAVVTSCATAKRHTLKQRLTYLQIQYVHSCAKHAQNSHIYNKCTPFG